MSILLDLLGAMVVGTTLLLLMITFQFQLQDTADRSIYSAQMIDHEQMVCNHLNKLFAMAGVGMTPDSTVVTAEPGRITFRTYWNYEANYAAATPSSFELKLSPTTSGVGRALTIKQNGEIIPDLGYILWLEDLHLIYYDKYEVVTNLPSKVRSVDVMVTLKRDPPHGTGHILRTKVQLKCYFMNCYMRGA